MPDPSEDKLDGPSDRAAVKEYGLPGHPHGSQQTAKRLPHLDQMRRPCEATHDAKGIAKAEAEQA